MEVYIDAVCTFETLPKQTSATHPQHVPQCVHQQETVGAAHTHHMWTQDLFNKQQLNTYQI